MENNFIDELIKEAEEKEELQTQSYFDLLLMEIGKMQDEIKEVFDEAEKEANIIREWALNKNSKIQNKIQWLEHKLENYIRSEGKKTIDLAHGVLKYHKKPNKLEVTNLDMFLKNAKEEMLTVIPEEVKPNLSKIRSFISSKGNLPKGVTVIEGVEEFSYKLNKEIENGKNQAGVAA